MNTLQKLTATSRTLSSALFRASTVLRPQCCEHLSKRGAGHSKWQNIRHIKAAKDAQKSATINQITQKIKIAVQATGNGDPKFNVQLRQVIEEGKSKDVPNVTMQNAIKRALAKKSTTVIFEARGPSNSCYMIELMTDQYNFARQEVLNAAKKCGISVGDNKGFASGSFTLRGVVYVPKAQEGKEELNEESALELAIETGAEEVEEGVDDGETPVFQLLCDPEEMWSVKKAVEKLAYSVSEARHEYIPNMFAYLNADQLDLAAKFLDKVESSGDIIKVYTNIKDEAEEQQVQKQ